MLEGDALEWFQRQQRQQKQPPNTPRRRQPKVVRNMSPQQRRVSSQTKNEVRAVYGTESQWNQTPEAPEGFEGTRNVGPSDLSRNDPGVGAKPTQSKTGDGITGRPKQRRRSTGQTRRTATDWTDLASKYQI